MSVGSDMRELKSSITCSLCEQIFTSPIHWLKATNFSETATHAIDFVPGGLSGIGPLMARNLDGRGVRVIVTGDKGKGDADESADQLRPETISNNHNSVCARSSLRSDRLATKHRFRHQSATQS